MNRYAIHITVLLGWIIALATTPGVSLADEPATPDFAKQVQPILRKYCAGCHNDKDKEGNLSLESYEALGKGGEHGAVVTPGRSESSRMIRMLTGKAEPRMPPADNAAPNKDEVAVLVAWINAGAKGSTGKPLDPADFATPKIPLRGPARDSLHAVTVSPKGDVVALAHHREVEIRSLADGKSLARLAGPRGSVNAVAFSADGQLLAAAGGEPNLYGEIRVWRTGSIYQELRTLRGHRDSLQAVRISPDGKLLASGGYDQSIKLWDLETGREVRSLDGHNGAVFDLAFRPDGKLLASASGDRTVKLWDVATGARLDTLNQSLMELYCVAFTPDGNRVAAGGVDNRIRVWSVSDSGREGTNPLAVSQFAHEFPVLRLAFAVDGLSLVSTGEDRLIKVWNPATMSIRATLPAQPDWVVGLAVTPDSNRVLAGRLDGSLEFYPLPKPSPDADKPLVPLTENPPPADYGPQPTIEQLPRAAEVEPNDQPAQATAVTLPTVATGKIFAGPGAASDADLFRFDAKKGDQWIIETNAGRSNSPVDTKIEVLGADGKPVPRLLLRAVRDSEIEFRSMDSNQRGVRLKNWEELLLNDYVYLNGEVIKHFQQRRGPDADGQFYPEGGSRYAFFDTTSRTHALGEPAYVVVPYAIGTVLPHNGLPVFTLNYENDDDGERKLGRDSRLTFVAPADGSYLVRVSDVRGFVGENFDYQLIVRRPQPSFSVSLAGANPTVSPGSGKEITVKAERFDNFDGPIRVEVTGLPPGFRFTSPLVIQAGLFEAKGVLSADADAVLPPPESAAAIKVTASAELLGKTLTKDVNSLGTIKLGNKPKVVVALELDPSAAGAAAPGTATIATTPPPAPAPPPAPVAPATTPDGIPTVTIVPGERATCRLRIERVDFKDRVQLEVFNLPHGVIVDDIGLNGVLIPEGQTERTIFLSCEPWVPATDRLFYAVAKVDGDQASLPLRIRVVPPREGLR